MFFCGNFKKKENFKKKKVIFKTRDKMNKKIKAFLRLFYGGFLLMFEGMKKNMELSTALNLRTCIIIALVLNIIILFEIGFSLGVLIASVYEIIFLVMVQKTIKLRNVQKGQF